MKSHKGSEECSMISTSASEARGLFWRSPLRPSRAASYEVGADLSASALFFENTFEIPEEEVSEEENNLWIS